MALVNIKEMLEKARKEHYAVGAFDASTIEMAMAIVEAAEEEKSPVIVMGLTPDLQQGNEKMLTYWTESLKDLAKKASVPVCLHLDHARDMNFLKRCVDAGFTSVMYDASEYPFEENVRLSCTQIWGNGGGRAWSCRRRHCFWCNKGRRQLRQSRRLSDQSRRDEEVYCRNGSGLSGGCCWNFSWCLCS